MDFATINLRLIVGFKSGWWMPRRILQLKSLEILTQMISFINQIFPYLSWLKLTWLGWINRPSAVFSYMFHSV